MPRKVELSTTVIELALETAQKAKAPDVLRMAQTVLVPSIFDVTDHTTGQIIGRSRATSRPLGQRAEADGVDAGGQP